MAFELSTLDCRSFLFKFWRSSAHCTFARWMHSKSTLFGRSSFCAVRLHQASNLLIFSRSRGFSNRSWRIKFSCKSTTIGAIYGKYHFRVFLPMRILHQMILPSTIRHLWQYIAGIKFSIYHQYVTCTLWLRTHHISWGSPNQTGVRKF